MPERKNSAKPVKLTARLERLSSETNWHVIRIPAASVLAFDFKKGNRRVVCTLNEKERFQCALMPFDGDFFIMVNKQIRTRLEIVDGDRVSVILEKDNSRYGLPMPAELREVLRQDPEGNRLFHSLTPGKQRSIIYYVGKIMDVDRRIAAALVFIRHLKKNGGRIDQKSLLEDLKRPAPELD